MTIIIRVYGVQISFEDACNLFGAERMERRVNDAVESYLRDPFELCSWIDGMTIKVCEL